MKSDKSAVSPAAAPAEHWLLHCPLPHSLLPCLGVGETEGWFDTRSEGSLASHAMYTEEQEPTETRRTSLTVRRRALGGALADTAERCEKSRWRIVDGEIIVLGVARSAHVPRWWQPATVLRRRNRRSNIGIDVLPGCWLRAFRPLPKSHGGLR